MNDLFIINLSFLCAVSAIIIGSILFRQFRSCNQFPPPSVLSSNFILLTNFLSGLEPILRKLKRKYGSTVTVSLGYRRSIYVGNHFLAHQLLIQNHTVFSDRPRTLSGRSISSAAYDPTWEVLRHNLASKVIHPSRVKSYSSARKWVLQVLVCRLQGEAGINVIDHFKSAMFSLLAIMCFGVKLDDHHINEIAAVQRRYLLFVASGRYTLLNIFPRLGKILFRDVWKELLAIRQEQGAVMIPHIISRMTQSDERILAYVDTLKNLKLPEEEEEDDHGRNLSHKEIVSMCSEFLNSGTGTTAAALQWVMANLIKHPDIQRKLYEEIVSVVGTPPPPPLPGVEPKCVIEEEKIKRMPYLKAVILEALRRHPPLHFVVPHRVTEKTKMKEFTIPQGATVNFMVVEMGLDPTVWEDPKEFNPERFLGSNGEFDVTGKDGIKMMPFGAGKRICPGYGLAMLHLQYFVANLIWFFHWRAPDGYQVDLSEKVDLFTIVMKDPLQAQLSSRKEGEPVQNFSLTTVLGMLASWGVLGETSKLKIPK